MRFWLHSPPSGAVRTELIRTLRHRSGCLRPPPDGRTNIWKACWGHPLTSSSLVSSAGRRPGPHQRPFLYALSRFQQDADGELLYSAVEEDLKRLLAEYGPPNKTTPAYPFHHLVSDGVWEVHTDRGPGSPGSAVRELRAAGAAGRLAPELRETLRREPSLLGRMARVLLDLHFPPSLHGELCEAVGLELEPAETGRVSSARRKRDRRMRELVLTAYEYQCAFCGYDGRIGARTRHSPCGPPAHRPTAGRPPRGGGPPLLAHRPGLPRHPTPRRGSSPGQSPRGLTPPPSAQPSYSQGLSRSAPVRVRCFTFRLTRVHPFAKAVAAISASGASHAAPGPVSARCRPRSPRS